MRSRRRLRGDADELRASDSGYRPELEERSPNHVINASLGHSAKVAEKRYLQMTPDHWTAGASMPTGNDTAKIGGVVGGVVSANHQRSGTVAPPVKEAVNGSGTLGLPA